MNHDELINKLGSMIDLEGLSFDDDGSCSVVFDDDEVFFEKADNHLFMFAPLCPVNGSEKLYREILEANFLSADNGSCTIAIDPYQDEYAVIRIIDGEVSYETFERILLAFIKCLRKWKKRILNDVPSDSKDYESSDKLSNIVNEMMV